MSTKWMEKLTVVVSTELLLKELVLVIINQISYTFMVPIQAVNTTTLKSKKCKAFWPCNLTAERVGGGGFSWPVPVCHIKTQY